MGRMVGRVASLAANSKTDNIFANKTEALITRPSHVRILATAAAVGVNMSVLAGNPPQLQMDDQEISGANRFPILPDDFVTEFVVTGPADSLVVPVRNTTGAAIANVVAVADITPLR